MELLNSQNPGMLSCSVAVASKTITAFNELFFLYEHVKLAHFCLINLFHYYTWKNVFWLFTSHLLCVTVLPPCSSTQTLWCHGEKYKPWGSNFMPPNGKKMPLLLLISHFLLSSSRQVWLLLCFLRNQSIAFWDHICSTSWPREVISLQTYVHLKKTHTHTPNMVLGWKALQEPLDIFDGKST